MKQEDNFSEKQTCHRHPQVVVSGRAPLKTILPRLGLRAFRAAFALWSSQGALTPLVSTSEQAGKWMAGSDAKLSERKVEEPTGMK
jgi:hypothetical protein